MKVIMYYHAHNRSVCIGNSEMNYISFGNGSKNLILLPGLGDGLSTVKGMAKDQAEAMTALGISKADILGISQGGMIAQYLAVDNPGFVGKLILAVTSAKPNEIIEKQLALGLIARENIRFDFPLCLCANALDFPALLCYHSVNGLERSRTQRLFVYGSFFCVWEETMKNKSIFHDFIKYVSLNILGQAAFSCYTVADTFFVSANLGADGITALNLAFPIFCLINGTGLMIGMGGGTRYSILKSRGDDEKADRIFTSAICMTACAALVYIFFGAFLSGAATKILGADNTVFDMTSTYLKVMLLFAPAFLFNHLFQCFVRNDGNPSLSMAAMIAGSLSNIVLDYIFIFPLRMGIFGAIFATGLAPVISMAVLSSYFIRKKNRFHFIKSLPKARSVFKILSSGVPSFVTEVTSGVVMLVFNFIILGLEGNIGVAAFAVITVISLVVVAIYTGLSQGIQPIISLNHGAGNPSNVKSILKYALITLLIISGAIYTIIFFGASQLVSIFNSENNHVLQALAVAGLRLYFLACPFIGFNIVTATYFASTEQPRPARIISFLRGFFVLIPMAFLLSALLKITGAWCAYPLTEFIVTWAGVVFYISSVKRNVLPRR